VTINQQTRILITHPFPDELTQPLHTISPSFHITHIPVTDADELADLASTSTHVGDEHIPTTDTDELAEHWPQVEVLYTSTVVPSLEQAPRLRWIQCHWAGVEQFLKHRIAARVRITTVSGIAAVTIAEYVFGGLLALTHHMPRLLHHQDRKQWPSGRWDKFVPAELRGATIGIIGYGSLGREVARLARAFGMRTLALKRNPERRADDGWNLKTTGDPDGSQANHIYGPEALHTMLSLCDHVVVTVPLTPNTLHLIGTTEFEAMKIGTIFVNVARGKIVDETALIAALQSGHLGGAVLDVFENEPLDSNSPLWQLKNVIISPHVSGITARYDELALRVFADNLRRYTAGQPLLNQVNIQQGY